MPPKVTPLHRFMMLFRGRENVYGQWVKDNVKTVHEPPKEEHWRKHLDGQGPFLGQVPVRLDNTCYFGGIDIDDDVIDHQVVAGIVEAAGLPLVVCRSKSGGAHLYVFFSEPVPAELVKAKLTQWSQAMGFKANHDGRAIEIFPKNAKLKPNDLGNWLNLPYYDAANTNRYAVDDIGTQLSLNEFLDFAENRRISEAKLEQLHPQIHGGFSDGPPCLQTLDQLGYPDGSRNMGLYNVGIYFKVSKPDGWQDEVYAYNKEKMDPPLKDRDVKAIVRSLEQKDYTYKCDDVPIQPHCQKALCKKQAFGIEIFRRQAKIKALPNIQDLRKVLTDPPRWIVNVEGKDVDLDTDQLMVMAAFRKVVFERCNILIGVLKMSDWDDVLTRLMASRIDIEAPQDAGVHGQFMAHFGEFLLRRYQSSTIDDIAAGIPYEEVGTGLVLFRAVDLTNFLERKKFRAFDTGQLFSIIRNMGGTYKNVKIKQQQVSVWSVKVPDNEQKTPLDSPKPKGPNF